MNNNDNKTIINKYYYNIDNNTRWSTRAATLRGEISDWTTRNPVPKTRIIIIPPFVHLSSKTYGYFEEIPPPKPLTSNI